MTQDYLQVNFRIPTKLKNKIEEAAKSNERSITGELVVRLEKSFEPHTNNQILDDSINEEMQLLRREAREMRIIYLESLNRNFENLPFGLKSNFAKLLYAALALDKACEEDICVENIYNEIIEDMRKRQ